VANLKHDLGLVSPVDQNNSTEVETNTTKMPSILKTNTSRMQNNTSVPISRSQISNSHIGSGRGTSLLTSWKSKPIPPLSTQATPAILLTPGSTKIHFLKDSLHSPAAEKALKITRLTGQEVDRIKQAIKAVAAGAGDSQQEGFGLIQSITGLYTMLRLLTCRRTAMDVSIAGINEQVLHWRRAMEAHSGKLTQAQLKKLQSRETLMLRILHKVFQDQEWSQSDLTPHPPTDK
jgi:hypothetical protein